MGHGQLWDGLILYSKAAIAAFILPKIYHLLYIFSLNTLSLKTVSLRTASLKIVSLTFD